MGHWLRLLLKVLSSARLPEQLDLKCIGQLTRRSVYVFHIFAILIVQLTNLQQLLPYLPPTLRPTITTTQQLCSVSSWVNSIYGRATKFIQPTGQHCDSTALARHVSQLLLIFSLFLRAVNKWRLFFFYCELSFCDCDIPSFSY